MSRAKRQHQHKNGPGPMIERKPSAVANPGPTRRTGRERPDAVTTSPDGPDPVARVIRTRK